jgi:imidazolonepropionase
MKIDDWDQIWVGAGLATMVADGRSNQEIADGAIALKGDRIAWIGSSAEGEQRAQACGLVVSDAKGIWITPGLIDCHTHLIYGGNRVDDFEQRMSGASYEQIARAGGGINSTIKMTRAATTSSLRDSAAVRLMRLMAEGVTTIEIKSGYGMSLEAEHAMLQVAHDLGRDYPITVRKTFLGLHALPAEYADDRQTFVKLVCGPWLSALHSAGLVDAVDAFCESIAFSVAETAKLLEAARLLDIRAHVHAGQLSELGAPQLAAQYRALSAAHLEFLSAEGAAQIARAGTVAVLLPTAYYTLQQSKPPPIPLLREMGVAMAVATDSNPGSSPCSSILLALNMACSLFGLTPQEALAGVTRNAARALGLESEIGTLEVGKRADLAFFRIVRPAELCYGLGVNPCERVIRGGTARDLRC